MMKQAVIDFGNRVLDIFYPRRCRYCGCVIDIRDDMCDVCQKTLLRTDGEVCKNCGAKKEDCVCGGKINYYESVYAPFYYSGAAKKAICQLKFHNRTEFADVLAEDMADCVKKHFPDFNFDICTFVPTTKTQLKKRGYNQADLLARTVGALCDTKCAELLVKTKNTEPQHTLPEMKRSGNLLGCFEIKDGVNVKGLDILLCDDVKTTGATLNECAKTLLVAGAARVFCLTAAITKDGKEPVDD